MKIPVYKRSELIEYIEHHLEGRRDMGNINSMDDEINFMMGACCALTFLTVEPDKNTGRRESISKMIPPYWLMNPIAGYSVLDDDLINHDPYKED